MLNVSFLGIGVDGTDTNMSNAVSGATSGNLVLIQSAHAGDGTAADDAIGGKGGAAVSAFTIIDGSAADLRGTVEATGGLGAVGRGANGFGGDGGAASASISLTGVGVVRATGDATGGIGGQTSHLGTFAPGGNTTSSATAVSANDEAIATANADAGTNFGTRPGGTASASAVSAAGAYRRANSVATAAGSLANATAEATTHGDDVISLKTYSNAPSLNATESITATAFAEAVISDFISLSVATAAASASGNPSELLQTVVLEGNPLSQAALSDSQSVILYAQQSVRHPSTASLTGASISTVVDMEFDTETLSGQDFLVAFLDPSSSGNGFDDLRFRIFEEESTVFDQSFVDLANALAFFDDSVLNLGAWSVGIDGILDLRFQLDAIVSGPNDRFSVDYLAGTAAVPVPPAVWLFGSALAMLGWLRRRKLH
jgi:hypothetical protein